MKVKVMFIHNQTGKVEKHINYHGVERVDNGLDEMGHFFRLVIDEDTTATFHLNQCQFGFPGIAAYEV